LPPVLSGNPICPVYPYSLLLSHTNLRN
jgi:hypothetical protein